MAWLELEQQITASAWIVFDVVAHMENYSKAIPYIKRFEFLTAETRGVGTKFLETRKIGRKEHTMEFVVKQYEPSKLVRLVTEGKEAVWDSTFAIRDRGDHQAVLKVSMDVLPKQWPLRLMLPLIKKSVRKGIETDLSCVKDYCERLADGTTV